MGGGGLSGFGGHSMNYPLHSEHLEHTQVRGVTSPLTVHRKQGGQWGNGGLVSGLKDHRHLSVTNEGRNPCQGRCKGSPGQQMLRLQTLPHAKCLRVRATPLPLGSVAPLACPEGDRIIRVQQTVIRQQGDASGWNTDGSSPPSLVARKAHVRGPALPKNPGPSPSHGPTCAKAVEQAQALAPTTRSRVAGYNNF